MIYRKVFYENQVLEGARLDLTDKGSLYFLGSGLTLRNCSIVTKVPSKNLIIDGVEFIDCALEVKQELKNHQDWVTASLLGCRFKGRFSGCDFGYWPEYSKEPTYQLGAIKNCDFTEARLDGCRFMDCDPLTLRLPGWPCFTILDPLIRAPELLQVKWPGSMGDVVIGDLTRQPARTRAVTLYAPALAEQFEATAEDIKAVIKTFDWIIH